MASIRKLHDVIRDYSRESLSEYCREFRRICSEYHSVEKREKELRKLFVSTSSYTVSFCIRPYGHTGAVVYTTGDCSVRFFYSSGSGRFSYSRCVELVYKPEFVSDFIKAYEDD